MPSLGTCSSTVSFPLPCPLEALITPHDRRVSILAKEVAKRSGFSQQECRKARLAGLVHDIGKTATAEMRQLFSSCEAFSLEERERAKLHCLLGVEVLKQVGVSECFLPEEVEAMEDTCLHHHKDFCLHSGYSFKPTIPDIIRVVDSFDAMVCDRTYKPTKSTQQALEELMFLSGRIYDPRVVEAFLELEHSMTAAKVCA